MSENKIWDFESMMNRYLCYDYVFDSEKPFDNWPWSTQIEIKQLQSVLCAFTGKKYNIESEEGKREIRDAFIEGFGLGFTYCNDEQLQLLKKLFPQKFNYFARFERDKPRVGHFYDTLFRVFRAGYEYITMFSGVLCAPVAFIIIDYYKSTEIDRFISDKNDVLIEAMKIVLGDGFRQTFTTQELIENYNYPAVSQDEIDKYNDDNL